MKNLDVVDKCPICSSKKRQKITSIQTINLRSKLKVGLYECNCCKHWWISPIPSQAILIKFYEKSSPYVVPKDYTGGSHQTLTHLEKYCLSFLPDLSSIRDKNYLEIGPGNGELLLYLKSKVAICYGVEPGNWKPKAESLIVPSLYNIPKNILFDIVVIQDVLEHVTNPSKLLSQVRSHCKKGCILRCGFPNKDSLGAQLYLGSWRMVLPFGHLHFFSKKSSRIMLIKSGWKIVKMKSFWSAIDWKEVLRSCVNINPFIFAQNLYILATSRDQWNITAVAV